MRNFFMQTFQSVELQKLCCGVMLACGLLSSGCQLPDYYRPGGYSSSYRRLQEISPSTESYHIAAPSTPAALAPVIEVPER